MAKWEDMNGRQRVKLVALVVALVVGIATPITRALDLLDLPGASNVLWSSSFDEPEWPKEWSPAMDSHPDNRTVVWVGKGAAKALLLTAPGGNDGLTGMGELLRSWFTDLGVQPRDEAYLRYRVYIPAAWNPYVGGKLPGLAGLVGTQKAGATPAGGTYSDDGWSGRVMWKRPVDGNPDKTRLQSYLYVRSAAGNDINANRNQQSGRIYGITVVFQHDPDPVHPRDASGEPLYLKRGAWNTIELRYTMNTPGQKNGIFQGWLNGELGVDIRDVVYRTTAHPNLSINELMFDSFYGGPTSNSTDQHWYFDDVSIRTSR